MVLNEHVNYNVSSDVRCTFTPDEGYALWDDSNEFNIDSKTGKPYSYMLSIDVPTLQSESLSSHIHAELIEDGMEVF